MPGKLNSFMNEEIVGEKIIQMLSAGMNNELPRVWNTVNNVLQGLGMTVPTTPPPTISESNFFRYDLKEKVEGSQNIFIVDVRAAIEEGTDRGIFQNSYDLNISYNQGKLIDERDIKRDYYAFRVRDAVMRIMEVGERLRITDYFNPKIKLSNIVNTEGDGFVLSYSVSN